MGQMVRRPAPRGGFFRALLSVKAAIPRKPAGTSSKTTRAGSLSSGSVAQPLGVSPLGAFAAWAFRTFVRTRASRSSSRWAAISF